MGFDAKKISIAFFILLTCIIGMVVITATMLVGTVEKIDKGFNANDSLHSVVAKEHKILMKRQDTIISNQKHIFKLLGDDSNN